jgi:sugar/nucleoside kinase (ribokinase family)
MSITALCLGHAAHDLCFIADAYPAENTKAQTESMVESGGGPAANAAWLLARWGVNTAFAGLLGNDNYGRRVVEELSTGGVDCALVELRAGHVTPVSAILVNRITGSRTIMNRRIQGAGMTLHPDKLSGLNPRLLLFDGHELDASLTAMQSFPHAITLLDAGSLREGTRQLSEHVDYLVSSQHFAAQITGQNENHSDWLQTAQLLQKRCHKTAIITLGGMGCVYDNGHERGRIPAMNVHAVDTTGAGDIFHGALAFGLIEGKPLSDALRLATVAAGLSVQQWGGRPSVPELSTVLKEMSHG